MSLKFLLEHRAERLLEHKENTNSDYQVLAKNKYLLQKLVSLFHQRKTKQK